jgi:YNFM family putative membrane transporter
MIFMHWTYGSRRGRLAGVSTYRRISVALFAAGVATFALLYSVQTMLPEFARSFGVSAGESTLALSLSTIGLGVALLVAGPLSEAYGRTRLIHASLWLSGLVALACAVAPGWHALLALRLLEGVTLAGLPAVATAYLREELPPGVQARASGLYIGGTAIGGMAGRLVPGAVTDVAGWRWGLATAAGLGLGCALAVRLLLPPSRHFIAAPGRPRHLAALIGRAGREPGLLSLYAVGGCLVGAFVAVFNGLVFRLTSAPYGLSVAAVSLMFLVHPAGAASATVAGRLAGRFGRRTVVAAGCLVTATGTALTLAAPLPLIVAGLALLTAGFFAVHGVASGWVPARAHDRGIASGPAASLYLVAFYAGSSISGSMAGGAWTVGGWPAVALLALTLVAAGTLAVFRPALRASTQPRDVRTPSPAGAAR